MNRPTARDLAKPLPLELLEVSLAIRIARHVSLCLAAFAQPAFAEATPHGRRWWPGRLRTCAGGTG